MESYKCICTYENCNFEVGKTYRYEVLINLGRYSYRVFYDYSLDTFTPYRFFYDISEYKHPGRTLSLNDIFQENFVDLNEYRDSQLNYLLG
jgi:hypothetical protein